MIDFTINWTDEKNDMLNLLSDKLWINNTLSDFEYLVFRYLQAQFDLSQYEES